MKKLFAALLVLSLLSGCGRIELGEAAGRLLPVSALALSFTPNGGVALTAESIRQDSLDGDAAPVYLCAAGDTLDEVFDTADQMLAHRLYLSHAQTIIVSPDFADARLDELTGFLLSRRDARLTMRIAVAHEASPEDVLRAEAIAEEIPGVALASLLDQRAREERLPDLPLYRLLDRRLSGVDFSLPVLTVAADGHAQPAGQAQFTKGRFSGFAALREEAAA